MRTGLSGLSGYTCRGSKKPAPRVAVSRIGSSCAAINAWRGVGAEEAWPALKAIATAKMPDCVVATLVRKYGIVCG